jgi:hypothetical protein
MKRFSVIILLIATSCHLFDKKVPNEDQLLQQELQKINWSQVDEYPSVYNCDTLQSVEQQKQCFFNYLTQEIQQKLSIDSIQMLYPNMDTIQVKVTVFPDKTTVFEIQQTNDSLTYNLKEIDSIIQNNLSNFPPIEPASKRGVKVKTQFILPVIIKKKQFF